MAIDIKTLRIGSHVLVDGKRAKVISVESTGIIGCKTDSDWLKIMSDEVEPIPITKDLLLELGFRKEDGFMRLWSKDDNGHFSYIEFSTIRDKWRLYPSGTDGSQTVVRYLHEAEAFLALHNIELIAE